jgi:hypothetical protein
MPADGLPVSAERIFDVIIHRRSFAVALQIKQLVPVFPA